MSRSVNMVVIIGNLTRDPDMRYTPQGHAVTSFGVATNRRWVSDGQERESTEFHNVVAWDKLAEICSQLLSKGRKVYIQGRLQTRTWDDQQGTRHWKTEIVADDMVVLDWRPAGSPSGGNDYVASDTAPEESDSGPEEPEEDSGKKEESAKEEKKDVKKKAAKDESKKQAKGGEDVDPGDMPF